MKIKQKATQTYYRTRNRNGLPGWAPAFYVLAGVVGFLYFSIQLFADDPTTRPGPQPQIVDDILSTAGNGTPGTVTPGGTGTPGTVPVNSVPRPTTPAPASTQTPAPPPAGTPVSPGEQQVTILDANGQPAQINSAALGAARAATVALFTGRFEDVPRARGVEVPNLNTLFENPEVSDPRLMSSGDGTIVVSFLVDPDRGGPASLRRIDTPVALEDGVWVWLGA